MENTAARSPIPSSKAWRCLAASGAAVLGLVVAACGGGGGSPASMTAPPPAVNGPAWPGFARDGQHSALGATAIQGGVGALSLNRIAWTSTIDLSPPTATQIHYGSPLVSAHNTVIAPVKTSAGGAFQVQALRGYDGVQLWSAASDYVLAHYNNWIPSFGPTLTAANRLYMPGLGGRVLYRDNVDSAGGMVVAHAFYQDAVYAANAAAFNASVFICTPITADAAGNIYFGFRTSGAAPAGLVSGFARIGADGTGAWVAANAAAQLGTATIYPAMNAAPALSPDGLTLYVAVATVPSAGNPTGYLVSLVAATLTTNRVTPLVDPNTRMPAWVTDDSSASPLVGPDGDVYYGVLESNLPAHNDRGWLLHFDSSLGVTKTPGSFGWDNTPSIVPAASVANYTGGSAYLLLTKYNNYADFPGGDGMNRMAILDPTATQADPVLPATVVMKEVMTVLGPTPDPAFTATKPNARKEWCVNTGAVDPVTNSVLVNSEDGYLYRWDLATGMLSQKIALDGGVPQAYTPTAIGPDGAVYAINAALLHAVRN